MLLINNNNCQRQMTRQKSAGAKNPLNCCVAMESQVSLSTLWLDKINNNELHLYVRAFWAGKLLQLQDSIPEEVREKAVDLLGAWTTTLSKGVSRVVLNKEEVFGQIQEEEFLTGPFLNWDKFKKDQILSLDPIKPIDEQLPSEEMDFLKASYYTKHASSVIHATVSTWTRDQFRDNYQNVLDVFNYEQDFVDVFELHLRGESSLALMITASYLERALGDVFEHVANNDKKGNDKKKDRVVCPRILRDLLATEELNNFLGEDVLFVLKTIIGPPIGLNLRNILWHGFLSEKEFDSYYTSFLFVLMNSLALTFKQLLGTDSTLMKRPLLKLNTISHELYDFGCGATVVNIDEFSAADWEYFERLIQRSFFILPERAPVFIQALKYLKSNDKLKYHRFSTLFLPQFEHALRRIFVAANNLPTPMLCAESRAYFTTLDILLDEIVGESQSNTLKDEIGTGAMNCLWDLFIHVAGPRPRDRISHGEADPSSIPYEVIDRFLAILIYLCCTYDIENKNQDYFAALPIKFKLAYDYIDNYISCFHPKSLLQRQFKTVTKSYMSLNQTIEKFPYKGRTEEESNEDDLYKHRRNDSADIYNTVAELNEHLKLSNEHIRLFMNDKYDSNELLNLETLKCSANEITLITSLRILLGEVDQLLVDYNNKIIELSSAIASNQATRRAQDSFYKLLGLMDLFTESFTWFIYLIEYLLLVKNEVTGQKEVKLINRCLTYVQRLQTKVKENQWATLVDTIKEMLKTVMKRV